MSASPGHETRDVTLRPLVVAGVAFFAVVVLVGPACILLLRHYARREARTSAPASPLAAPAVPPAPRLQVEPRKDLQTLHAEEDAVLGSYGWVDRTAGTVHIPIEEAMRLLVERRGRDARR